MKHKLSMKFFLDGGSISNLHYSTSKNILFIAGRYGSNCLYMPKQFFIKSNKLSFLFLDKYSFFSVWKHFISIYSSLHRLFFFRLKLKGLGYRIRKITRRLYRLFFAFKHFFYLHVPHDIFVKHKKRLIVLFSANKSKLNDIFSHMLLLKKMDFYEKTRAFIMPNKILYLKKRK